jgi:3-hydroxyisobutyrate dehydrogenase-like beta-hydroxyacid dehydrogenase
MKIDSVSVIGLDAMGRAIAARVMACGFPVSVFDHSRERVTEVGSTGAGAAAIPADAAEDADIVFVNMPDEAACLDVLLDHGGVGETLRSGGYVIDASPTGDAFNIEANRKLGRFGITRVPVQLTGDPRQAAQGGLRIAANCRRSDLAAIGHVLDSIAVEVRYLGRDDETTIDRSLERMPVLDPL